MSSAVADELRYIGTLYGLSFPDDRPFVFLTDQSGDVVLAELFVASGVRPVSGLDDATSLGPWSVARNGDTVTFCARGGSPVWHAKEYRFVCAPDHFRYEVVVEGMGDVAAIDYFGGNCSAWPRWGSGFFLSGHQFLRGFNPEPNADDRWYFDPTQGTVIDLTGGPLPGRRHWFFTPPPFCYAFDAGQGWLALGVEAPAGENTFTELRYVGGDGFFLTLSCEGGLSVEGTYTLPAIGFHFAPNEFDALGRHAESVRRASLAPRPRNEPAAWWSEPMFCGWGAQCARAAQQEGYEPTGDLAVDGPAFVSTMRHAGAQCRQDVYESFLYTLDSHGVRPGTVTIDDKWQLHYGVNDVDPAKWPDLPDFICRRHDAGQRVLLWLKAWDPEGVPEDECIRNAAGVPLTVDPTHPAYMERLRADVRRMLAPEGYGADGFKIDFTHRIPVGPRLTAHGQERGLELMRRYLAAIYSEAKAIKPDALIITHTPHPYLADVVDMIRLNDMLDLTRLADPSVGGDIGYTVSMRARVARAACPAALIDTDNWPVRDRATWREYVRFQASIGVPSLYFADRIDLTQEPLDDDDYQLIVETWSGAVRGNAPKTG